MGLASRLGARFRAAFAAEVVTILAGGLLVFLLARLLDPDEYGVLFLAIAILSTGRLLSAFGISKSASRYVAEYKETDPGQIPHILRTALGLNLVTIGVVSIAIFLGSDVIADLVGEPAVRPLLQFGSVFIVSSTLFYFVRWTLQGLEEIQIASAFTSANKVIRLAFAIGFVLVGYGAIGALVGYIVGFAVTATVGFTYLFVRVYRGYSPSAVEPGLRKRIAKYSSSIAVTQSAHMLDHHFDRILVGFFAGPVAVAYYTLGKQALQFVGAPMSALGFALSPSYGAQKAQGNADTAAQIYETALSKGLLLYIPAGAGLALLAEPIVLLVFGTDYAGAIPVVQVFSIMAVLQSVTKLTGHGLDYLGRAKARAVVKGVTAVLNVGLNVVLIPLYGATGAAIATVVTFALYTGANIYVMHRELDLRVGWLLQQTGYAVGITAVMSTIVYALSSYIVGIVTMIFVVCAGVAVWATLVLAFDLVRIEELKEAI